MKRLQQSEETKMPVEDIFLPGTPSFKVPYAGRSSFEGENSAALEFTNWSVAAVIFGVVLAVVAPVFNFPESYIGVKCKWRSESGQVLCSRNKFTYGEDMGECAVMWLHFVNPSMFCFPETSFHFSIYDGWDDEHVLRDDVKILKCGIAPINNFHIQNYSHL